MVENTYKLIIYTYKLIKGNKVIKKIYDVIIFICLFLFIIYIIVFGITDPNTLGLLFIRLIAIIIFLLLTLLIYRYINNVNDNNISRFKRHIIYCSKMNAELQKKHPFAKDIIVILFLLFILNNINFFNLHVIIQLIINLLIIYILIIIKWVQFKEIDSLDLVVSAELIKKLPLKKQKKNNNFFFAGGIPEFLAKSKIVDFAIKKVPVLINKDSTLYKSYFALFSGLAIVGGGLTAVDQGDSLLFGIEHNPVNRQLFTVIFYNAYSTSRSVINDAFEVHHNYKVPLSKMTFKNSMELNPFMVRIIKNTLEQDQQDLIKSKIGIGISSAQYKAHVNNLVDKVINMEAEDKIPFEFVGIEDTTPTKSIKKDEILEIDFFD